MEKENELIELRQKTANYVLYKFAVIDLDIFLLGIWYLWT